MAFQAYCPVCARRFPDQTATCPDDGSPLLRVPEEDLVGKTVDRRYAIQAVIGEGGMGTVYRAVHQMLQRDVALKVIRRDAIQDETSVKRFMTEARAIAALKNPHTVTVFDSGVTEDGALYYTMELLTGRPLSHVLRKEGAVDYRRAAELVCQVCESLEEAHAAGILHRDIKPDNIVLVREKGREFAKLVDFGIAKVLGEAADGPHTRTGMLVGTPRYLSPEQVSGEPVGPSADLYALGIVLYELLTGTPPFSGQTPAEIMMAHIQDRPEPLPSRTPGGAVPPALQGFVDKALQKNPARRFASAAEFSAALSAAVGAVRGPAEDLGQVGFDATMEALETPLPHASPGLSGAEETLAIGQEMERTVTTPMEAPSTVGQELEHDGETVAPIALNGTVRAPEARRPMPWWILLLGVALLLAVAPLLKSFFWGGNDPEESVIIAPQEVKVATPGAPPPGITGTDADVQDVVLVDDVVVAAPVAEDVVQDKDVETHADVVNETRLADAVTGPDGLLDIASGMAQLDVEDDSTGGAERDAMTSVADTLATPKAVGDGRRPQQSVRTKKRVRAKERDSRKEPAPTDSPGGWFDDVEKLPTN